MMFFNSVVDILLLIFVHWSFSPELLSQFVSVKSKVEVLIVSTPWRLARLSWAGWLTTHQYGLPVCWWSPALVLTSLDVD